MSHGKPTPIIPFSTFVTSQKAADFQGLIIKIKTIEETYEQRWTIEKEENDQKYKEYLQSEEYKQVLKDEEEYKHVQELEYQKKEEDRLKLCIELYGEEKGREFHQRL